MIDKLEYVVALGREKHFGRAAEACGVTQPTLSAGLKQLEDALGVLIVKRSSRFLGFTPEGERVLAWGHRMVRDAQAMRDEIKTLKQGLNGHLRIAAIPSALPRIVSLTTPFAERHPAVRFTIISRPSEEILRRIEQFEIDAGVTYLDADALAPVKSIPLYYERFCFVASEATVPPDRSSIDWSEIGGKPLCLLSPDMQNRRIVDKVSRSAGVELVPRIETDSVLVLLSHVQTGHWASILPAAILDMARLPKGIVALPITGPEITNLIGLIVPNRNPMTTLVQALFVETSRFDLQARTPQA